MNTQITGNLVSLKSIQPKDLPVLWKLIYGKDNPEWKKWDAPYFPLKAQVLSEYKKSITVAGSYDSIAKLAIWTPGQRLIGTVGYYWEHELSNWLEIGISIYLKQYWSNGLGKESLALWISHLFESMPLVRVGLTTWSGNTRMLKCAESLGMKQEARLRKCRFWEGEYYDSIRYGVLREEWIGREPKGNRDKIQPGVIIRQAMGTDAEALDSLYRMLVDNPNINVLPKRLESISTDPHTYLLVCEVDGIVCGTILLTLCLDAMFGVQPFGVIENIVVAERWRSSRLGSQLLARVEAICQQHDCSKILLLSSAVRGAAHRFFQQHGFSSSNKSGFVKYRSQFSRSCPNCECQQ